MSHVSTRALLTCLIVSLFCPALLADGTQAAEEDIIYIDDFPELDPLSQKVEEPEKRIPDNIGLKSIRFAMPSLGSENWWKGTWGLGLEWKAAHYPSAWEPLALRGEYAFSSLGFDGAEGFGNYASMGLLWKPERGLELGAVLRGLFVSDSARSWFEAPLGLGFRETPSGLPWRGAWLNAGLVAGMGGSGETWFKALASYEHLFHALENRVIIAPRAGIVASFGDIPVSRRTRMRNGRFEASSDIGMGSPQAEGSILSCLSLSLETRFMLSLYTMGGGGAMSAEMLLALGLKPWLYVEDILEKGAGAAWKSGVSFSAEFGAYSRSSKDGLESYTCPFGVELTIPFATIDRIETWALSFKTFLDPVELFGL